MSKPQEIEVGGVRLACHHCGHREFHSMTASISKMPSHLFDVFARGAHCYVCDRCGFVHWFLPRL